MNDLERASAKLKYLETLLHMCDWSLEGRSLHITCLDHLAQKLTKRCEYLALKFEHLEKVWINGVLVFEQEIPVPEQSSIGEIYGCTEEPTELFLPVLTQGMKVTPEMMASMFPDQTPKSS